MAMINNWDLKDSNNVIIKIRGGNNTLLRHQRSRCDVWTREHHSDLLATDQKPQQSG